VYADVARYELQNDKMKGVRANTNYIAQNPEHIISKREEPVKHE